MPSRHETVARDTYALANGEDEHECVYIYHHWYPWLAPYFVVDGLSTEDGELLCVRRYERAEPVMVERFVAPCGKTLENLP